MRASRAPSLASGARLFPNPPARTKDGPALLTESGAARVLEGDEARAPSPVPNYIQVNMRPWLKFEPLPQGLTPPGSRNHIW